MAQPTESTPLGLYCLGNARALLPWREGGRVRLPWRQGLWAGPPGRGTQGLRSEPWSTGPHLEGGGNHSQDTGAIIFEKTASVYSE